MDRSDYVGMEAFRSIATDQQDYLREHPEVAAEGSARGWRAIRYRDGKWLAAKQGGTHRLRRHVTAEFLDDTDVFLYLLNEPVTLYPAESVRFYGDPEWTLWEMADLQQAYADVPRCFWCGDSEQMRDLDQYATVDHGEIHLCPECRDSWDRADELAEQDDAESTV